MITSDLTHLSAEISWFRQGLLSVALQRFWADQFWIRRALFAAFSMGIGLLLQFNVA